jgi:hypothetical protein
MLPTAKCRIDINRTSHENPIVVCPDHERIPVAADKFAAIFFARRCGRDIHLVPIDLFAGKESNRHAAMVELRLASVISSNIRFIMPGLP